MNKDKIKNILRESHINEAEELEGKATDSQYQRVSSLLDNDKINHAGVIRQLWPGDSDATKRSLFRKKLNKENNDSGGTYSFTKEEVAKIISILTNFANEISATLKPKSQTFKGDK